MFEESKETLDVILQARKIVFNTDFKYETEFLNKLFSYLPIRIEYNLIRSSVDCDTYPILYENFKELEWNDKRMTKINFIRLVSEEELKFVIQLLTSIKVQEWLSYIHLKTNNLSDCLKILELLENCISISIIILKYKDKDIDSEEESINNAIKKFSKKIGLISNLSISQLSFDDANYDI